MDTIVERPGALDIHKSQITACVRVPGGCAGREELREFATTTAGLLTLRTGWRSGVTASGWKPPACTGGLFCTCWRTSSSVLVNAPHSSAGGVGLALRLLSDVVLEQSSVVGFDLDS